MKWLLALLLIVLCYTQAISAWDRNQERDNFMDLQEKEFMDSEDSEDDKIIDLQEEINKLNEDISCLKGDIENLKKEKEVLKERSSKVSTLCGFNTRPRPTPIPRPRPTRPPVAMCKQPKVVGRCTALIPRWYFNIHTGQCEQFNYGGCGGNGNNFETEEECNRKCGKKGCPRFDPWPDPVGQRCNAIDRCDNEKCTSKSKLCCPTRCGFSCVKPENEYNETEDEFISKEDVEDDYEEENEEKKDDNDEGGEEWTPDNVEDHDDDEDMSDDEDDMEDDWESVDETGDDKEHDVCSQPKKVGPCKKAVQRWFYHSKSGICKKFTYGGCKGNGNNFETKQECKDACCTDEEEFGDSEEEEQEEGDDYKDQEENMEDSNKEGCYDKNGKFFEVGKSYFDGCNTCVCTKDFKWICTKKYCPPKGCCYNGCFYKKGQSFLSADGCNKCFCDNNGNVPCTKKYCFKVCPHRSNVIPGLLPKCSKSNTCPKGKMCCPYGCKNYCVEPIDRGLCATGLPMTDAYGVVYCGKAQEGFNCPQGSTCNSATGVCCSNVECPKKPPASAKKCPKKKLCPKGKLCCTYGCKNLCVEGVEPKCPDGDPVVDATTGIELFCGRGPGRVDCPKGTYCNIHPTDRYAVCCKQEQPIPVSPVQAKPVL